MFREFVFGVILPERKASGGRPSLIKHKDHSRKVANSSLYQIKNKREQVTIKVAPLLIYHKMTT